MANDVEVLRGLLARVKAATGPDPILDRYLCHALGVAPWAGTPAEHLGMCMPGSKMAKATPALTASIDAAVALVGRALPGWHWHACSDGYREKLGGGACVFHGKDDFASGDAATTPLAICAALLTALIAAEADHG
ncbi:hypothetical protein [Methylobacterium sp. WL8]|uniref:hypothetical protein n=1 Tax=Methylobacterium sp. WL8 TaxID=2603899 RepID=UPI0011C73A19|nr:hypothetical protein [Methylobacterium sp. WL8]TXN80619.1 hypothetical protein FV234_16470 [Methylobacterium sp. WL8]